MKRILNIFFISILMVIALTACGGKEATPAPVPTPEPINLAAKEPTADPMDACAAGISLPLKTDYPLVFCDNFEDPGIPR
jgi:predicted small lipoprotein YifL